MERSLFVAITGYAALYLFTFIPPPSFPFITSWVPFIANAFAGTSLRLYSYLPLVLRMLAFLHSSLSPSVELAMWPPVAISAINPLTIPLLGSVILLASGFILTLSHIILVAQRRAPAILGLAATILFGAIFLLLQFTEYRWAEVTIADSVLGSTFYMTTGLHALHVIAGALFLALAIEEEED